MKIFKQLFCKHNYKKIATRKSSYCSDYLYFSDLGDYEEILYECCKCGKTKIKIINKRLISDWEYLERNDR